MTTSPYTFAEFKDKGNKLLLTTLGVNKAIRENNHEALKQSLAQLKIISEQLSQYVDQVEPRQ